jgi:hypothetical protein
MSDDEGVWPRRPRRWAAFTSSVPGLVVSASSVTDMVACLRLVSARQDMGSLIEKIHVGEVASPRAELDEVGEVC